jgi:hypothetical protein
MGVEAAALPQGLDIRCEYLGMMKNCSPNPSQYPAVFSN